jgi:hypothetical protein
MPLEKAQLISNVISAFDLSSTLRNAIIAIRSFVLDVLSSGNRKIKAVLCAKLRGKYFTQLAN